MDINAVINSIPTNESYNLVYDDMGGQTVYHVISCDDDPVAENIKASFTRDMLTTAQKELLTMEVEGRGKPDIYKAITRLIERATILDIAGTVDKSKYLPFSEKGEFKYVDGKVDDEKYTFILDMQVGDGEMTTVSLEVPKDNGEGDNFFLYYKDNSDEWRNAPPQMVTEHGAKLSKDLALEYYRERAEDWRALVDFYNKGGFKEDPTRLEVTWVYVAFIHFITMVLTTLSEPLDY